MHYGCKNNNIDISHRRGRQFIVSDFDKFDHIYVMDHANYGNILFKARKESDKKKVKLIMSESEDPTKSQKNIPDPYYGDISDFERIFQQLDEVCSIITEKLLKNQ